MESTARSSGPFVRDEELSGPLVGPGLLALFLR